MLPERLADVWAVSGDLEEQPLEDIGLLVIVFRPQLVLGIIMLGKIKQNGTGLPHNKIIPLMIH